MSNEEEKVLRTVWMYKSDVNWMKEKGINFSRWINLSVQKMRKRSICAMCSRSFREANK